jgi:hypothetical protein
VAPAFSRSADFPIDKPAGVPCVNLAGTSCTVHPRLRPLGFAGCVAYDCFGAGQRVSALPVARAEMYAALPVLRQLHELLWYLAEAAALAPSAALSAAADRVSVLASGVDLLAVDVAAERAAVAPLLLAVSGTVRRGRSSVDRAGADLVGAALAGADLSYAVLRGALLIGADLRGATLVGAELLGADLRGADLSGADLTGALYLTQSQVGAALGSPATTLPPALVRPPHWT